MTIELSGLQFHAFHGMYPEEKILGNDFIVDVKVECNGPSQPLLSIDQTINYERVFELVKAAMDKPTPLLETVASKLAYKIGTTFDLAKAVSVKITKMQPPIERYRGIVSVSFTWQRSAQ